MLAVACGDGPAGGAGLAPIARLVEGARSIAPRSLYQVAGRASVGGLDRPVVLAPRTAVSDVRCVPRSRARAGSTGAGGAAGARTGAPPSAGASASVGRADASGALVAGCAAGVPEELRAAPWVALRAAPQKARLSRVGRGRSPRATTGEEHQRLASWRLVPRAAARSPVRLPAGTGRFVAAWPILEPSRLAATSAAVRVPKRAVLRFAIGFHESVRATPGSPGDERITALVEGGGQVEVFHARIDPRTLPGWREERVPLPRLAGRRVRFAFSWRRAAGAAGGPPSPLLWGDPVVLAPRGGRAERRSVVLVSLDTLRARSTSLYGYERETTPGLERIARSGVLFRRVYTTFSNTLGAHASMLTGLYPAHHRTVLVGHHLPRERPTLAELLRRAGYQTAAFTEDGLLSARYGFSRGFSYYWENLEVEEGAGDAQGTFSRALGWLERHRREGPFLLFVHTYAVHHPYVPAVPYRRLFVEAEQVAGEPPARAGREKAQLAYEQEVRELDDDVTRLVARLDALVSPDRTVLVVTADHGEEFREHGKTTHKQLFDEVMHVPLLIRAPGLVPEGLAVDGLVSLVDLLPTILDLVRVAPPEGLDGESLVALWREPGRERGHEMRRGEGRGGGGPHGRVVFGQSPPLAGGARDGWTYVARRRDAKCMVRGDGEAECFDLASDPKEQRPESPAAGARFEALAAAAARYAAGDAGRERRAPAARPAVPDERQREKLRALGYVE